VAIDLWARLFAFGTIRRWLRFPTTWIDLVVLATLLFPVVLSNWGFLRILRLWTVVHSERFWNVLARGKWDDTYVEDVSKAASTLITFVFVAAGVTLVLFPAEETKLYDFAGALQFVVSLLTATGYGDIYLYGVGGRLFSAALMIAGITLFLAIAQKVIRPPRKLVTCLRCGMNRHELDARHCRNCGTELSGALRGRARAARSARGKGG
jgi:voltage-gated potassium channel